LALLLNQLPFFHGRPIPTPQAASHVIELQQVLDSTAQIVGSADDMPNLLVSDASESHAFVYLADGTFRFVADFPFLDDQRGASSTLRELLALSKTLLLDGQSFLAKNLRLLYWQTDNKACTWIIQHGSRNPTLQRIVFTIKCRERDLGISVIPVWTPRLHPRIVLADAGSRFSRSTDEWSVHRPDLAEIFCFFNFLPDIDCFASATNAVCPKFFSKVPQLGSAGVDFFAQRPQERNLFLCPPVSCVSQGRACLKK